MKALGRFVLLVSSLLLPDHFGTHGTTGSYTATDAKYKQQYKQVWEPEAGLVLLCLFEIYCLDSLTWHLKSEQQRDMGHRKKI